METEAESPKFYGWWLLLFLCIVYTIPIGFAFYSPVVLYPFMSSDIGWSRGGIMVGSTSIVLVLGLTGPFTAWMIGRFGARVTIFVGGVIIVLATSIMGVVGHIYPVYVALSLLIGLGVSLGSMIPVQTVVISWFNARRALALGLVMGGGAIGGFLMPQLISSVVLNANGEWRTGWFLIAAVSLVGAIMALIVVRNRPSDMGQYPDGLLPADIEQTNSTKKPIKTYRTAHNWTVRDALKTRAFWLLVIAVAGSFFLWQVIVTQTPFHLQDRGFDPSKAVFFYSLAIGLSIAGRFTIAGLGDTIEPRYLFASGTFCILIGGVLFWFVSPDVAWTAYLYPLVAGFGFGTVFICFPTIIGNYWGAEAFAGVNGLVLPVALTIQAMAAPFAGFFYDIQGNYITILMISGAGSAVGFTAMLLCKPPALGETKNT